MAASDVHVLHVLIQSSADIVAARQHARALAARAGFSHSDLTMIATAVSEIARNIVDYANDGEIIVSLIDDAHKKGVEIVAVHRGPGIPDVSVGTGLPGAKCVMDEFEFLSEIGRGTTVRMKKWAV